VLNDRLVDYQNQLLIKDNKISEQEEKLNGQLFENDKLNMEIYELKEELESANREIIKIDNKNRHGEITAYSIAFFKIQMKNKGIISSLLSMDEI
jgi:regulator of replication initiation timing